MQFNEVTFSHPQVVDWNNPSLKYKRGNAHIAMPPRTFTTLALLKNAIDVFSPEKAQIVPLILE